MTIGEFIVNRQQLVRYDPQQKYKISNNYINVIRQIYDISIIVKVSQYFFLLCLRCDIYVLNNTCSWIFEMSIIVEIVCIVEVNNVILIECYGCQ